jgi:hypothetical protein
MRHELESSPVLCAPMLSYYRGMAVPHAVADELAYARCGSIRVGRRCVGGATCAGKSKQECLQHAAPTRTRHTHTLHNLLCRPASSVTHCDDVRMR